MQGCTCKVARAWSPGAARAGNLAWPWSRAPVNPAPGHILFVCRQAAVQGPLACPCCSGAGALHRLSYRYRTVSTACCSTISVTPRDPARGQHACTRPACVHAGGVHGRAGQDEWPRRGWAGSGTLEEIRPTAIGLVGHTGFCRSQHKKLTCLLASPTYHRIVSSVSPPSAAVDSRRTNQRVVVSGGCFSSESWTQAVLTKGSLRCCVS
jgi:hypothetical protein